jgi:hypothetical protein
MYLVIVICVAIAAMVPIFLVYTGYLKLPDWIATSFIAGVLRSFDSGSFRVVSSRMFGMPTSSLIFFGPLLLLFISPLDLFELPDRVLRQPKPSG